MLEAMNDPARLLPLWEEALKAKFMGTGKPFSRAELDKLLGDFDVRAPVTGSPSLLPLARNS